MKRLYFMITLLLFLSLLCACAPATDAVVPAPQNNTPTTPQIGTPTVSATEAPDMPDADEAEPESEKIDTRNRVTVSSSILPFSFEEACNMSIHVAYGEVLSKGDSTVIEYEGQKRTDCYRPVTIEVIESAKGGLEPGDTLTYREFGGETEEKIYYYAGSEIVEPGDKVLIFQSAKLGPVNCLYFWIINDRAEDIAIYADVVENVFEQKVMALSEDETYISTTVDEILQAVRDYVDTDAEIMNDATVE